MIDEAHAQLHELSGLYVLGSLEADERERFEAHLGSCATCAAEVESLRGVVKHLPEVLSPVGPPADLRRRVLAAAGSGGESRLESAGSRVGSRSVIPWLAAAAAILVAVGLGWGSLQLRTRLSGLESRLDVALDRATAAESRLVELAQATQRTETTAAILVAPDLARIELAGQAAAPDARARAFWSRANGLVITVEHLPPLPPGRVYQIWVVTADSPVSAGLLQPDAEGQVTAVIETPQDLPQPLAMAVTIEPEGGVPAPTGAQFLVGTPATSL